MHYVYMIESASEPDRKYVGYTDNLRQRMTDHNTGKNVSTALHRP
jgi:predicted GIY-YIG superfamily endonuclease